MVRTGEETQKAQTELRPEMGLDLCKTNTEATPSAWAHGDTGKMDQVSS